MDIKEYGRLNFALKSRNTIRGALFHLKKTMPEFERCELGYEYFVAKNAFMRGDIINVTTLPRSLTDLYGPSGGTNADPIVENIADMRGSLTIDITKLCSDPKSKYYKHAFFEALRRYGCESMTAYSFLPPDDYGFGALTVMKFTDSKAEPAAVSRFADIGYALHTIIKRHKHIKKFLKLTDVECHALRRMAQGKTAQDVAHELSVTARTIELRLQSARKKLRARTTTEAVYKSVCYGVI